MQAVQDFHHGLLGGGILTQAALVGVGCDRSRVVKSEMSGEGEGLRNERSVNTFDWDRLNADYPCAFAFDDSQQCVQSSPPVPIRLR